MVSEPNPPEGEPAVEWILLTSLPIETLDQVRQVIQNYCVRWLIEVFFRTLKSGCRVEDRRFEGIDRFLPCLAIYLIVTWRTLYVCRLGREFPDISCEAVFEPAEWQSVYQVVHRKAPPATPPSLGEMVRLAAQLGGYVNRKRDDPPGPQTIWLGLQRVHDIALCWMRFGPGAGGKRCVEQPGRRPAPTVGRGGRGQRGTVRLRVLDTPYEFGRGTASGPPGQWSVASRSVAERGLRASFELIDGAAGAGARTAVRPARTTAQLGTRRSGVSGVMWHDEA